MLDPYIKGLLDAGRASGAPALTEMTRDALSEMIVSLGGAGTPDSPTDVASRSLDIASASGTIPARLYTPADVASPVGIVYYHGGGFVVGDLNAYDEFMKRLAAAANLRVLAVDYRLAPEHPFPAGHDDALAAATWALEHAAEIGFDPNRLIVAGDSAGGNLAAATAFAFRERKSDAIALQALLYPWLRMVGETPSLAENGEGYMLTRADLDSFAHDTFVTDADKRDPRVSISARTDLTGLAPALVVTAGYDPLRDEGRTYAENLERSGVRVKTKHYPEFVHGFYGLSGVSPAVQPAIEELGAILRAAAGTRATSAPV